MRNRVRSQRHSWMRSKFTTGIYMWMGIYVQGRIPGRPKYFLWHRHLADDARTSRARCPCHFRHRGPPRKKSGIPGAVPSRRKRAWQFRTQPYDAPPTLNAATNILLVGCGGFAGAVARYLLGGWMLHHAMAAKFPWSTFTVNVLGCLLMGLLSGFIERLEWFTPQIRLLLLTGLLGGFTTFSAFGFETVYLLRRGEVWIAAAYVLASVLVCVGALWIGLKTVEFLPGG